SHSRALVSSVKIEFWGLEVMVANPQRQLFERVVRMRRAVGETFHASPDTETCRYPSSAQARHWVSMHRGRSPSSVRNWRRLTSSMGPSAEPAMPAYRRLRMPWKHPQVLGLDLNRSERAGARSGCARDNTSCLSPEVLEPV